MIVRIGASLIVFISGHLLENYSFKFLMLLIASVIFALSFYSVLKIRKFEKISV